MDDKTVADAIGAIAAAGAAYGTASLPAAIAAGPAAALAFLPFVAGKVVVGYQKRKVREAEKWWELVVMENSSDYGAAAQIGAKADDPISQDVIVASFKLILDNISPEAIPAIAMLTREYLREGKVRDDFFRGTGEVLTDLSAEEFSDLRALVAWVASSSRRADVEILHLGVGSGSPEGQYEHLEIRPEREGRPPILTPLGFPMRFVPRLFRLLKKSALATEAASGYLGAISGPHVLAVGRTTMDRLQTILG
jgi:hypothetical protein